MYFVTYTKIQLNFDRTSNKNAILLPYLVLADAGKRSNGSYMFLRSRT